MKWKRKRKNKGWFRKGHDPRRHKFTASDARVGWLVANILYPELREWLRMRAWCFYSERKRKEKKRGKKKGRAPNRNAGDSTRDASGRYAGGYTDDTIPF